MVNKVPPPPTLTLPEWQPLNRWLIELQGILNSDGNIDPAEVEGLIAAYDQIAANVIAIAGLNDQITALNQVVTTQGAAIVALSGQILTLQAQISALEANPVIRFGAGPPSVLTFGRVGDLYMDLSAVHPTTILYGMQSATIWTAIA